MIEVPGYIDDNRTKKGKKSLDRTQQTWKKAYQEGPGK